MAAATSSAFSHEELIADKVTFQRRRLTPIDESTRDVSTRHVVSLVTCLEAPKNEILKISGDNNENRKLLLRERRGSHVARAQRDDLLRDLVAPLALSFRSRLPPPRARARWRRAPSPSGSGYTT